MQPLGISTPTHEGRRAAEKALYWLSGHFCDLPASVLKAILLMFAVVPGVGCKGAAIKTHPVSGKVEVKDGDVAMLTQSSIQFVQEGDETIRPYGNIDASGNFTVKTLYKGDIVQGAPAGNYKARIMLADESDEGVPKRKGNPIHPRYLNFATSGLSVIVPSGDVKFSLSKK